MKNRRRLVLTEEVLLETYDESSSTLILSLKGEDFIPLALEISMLSLEMSDELVLTGGAGLKLRLSRSRKKIGDEIEEKQEDLYSINLTMNTIGYLHVFCLDYYCDGYTPVDHLDIELEDKTGDLPVGGLMVCSSEVGPAVPTEEAIKILRKKTNR